MSTPTDPGDRDPDDLARRLRNQLEADTGALDVPEGDLDAVVARGRRTRTIAVGGAVAMALVLGAAAWVGADRLLDAPPQVVIEQPPVVTTPTPTPSPTPETAPTPTAPETTPTPLPTQASEPSPTPAPTPTPDPTPRTTPQATPEPSPAPTTPAVGGGDLVPGPLLVAATDDGIVVWSDGEATRVPGIDGPVDQAFDDGRGNIVFQRNDQGIGRLVDGRVETLVAVSEFPERAFDDGLVVAAPPDRLELHDVDPTTGRIAFSVHHANDVAPGDEDVTDAGPSTHAVDVVADLDGGDRRELGDRFTFEQGVDLSLGGPRVLARDVSETGSGGLVLSEDNRVLDLDWDADFAGEGADVGDTESLIGAQLDHRGDQVAYIRAVRQDGFTLVVRDVVTGEVRTELDVNDRATFVTRLGFDGHTAVLFGESDRVDVLDVASGEWTTTTIPSLRSATPGLAADEVSVP